MKTQCYGIACTCGSRRTARATEGERRRLCCDCGKSFVWRVVGGLPVPFAPETAAALEEASRA